jgi:hypothetical protein
MDFAQAPQPTMQPGQSGNAAKPSPQEIMQKIAMIRAMQPQNGMAIQPPVTQ